MTIKEPIQVHSFEHAHSVIMLDTLRARTVRELLAVRAHDAQGVYAAQWHPRVPMVRIVHRASAEPWQWRPVLLLLALNRVGPTDIDAQWVASTELIPRAHGP